MHTVGGVGVADGFFVGVTVGVGVLVGLGVGVLVGVGVFEGSGGGVGVGDGLGVGVGCVHSRVPFTAANNTPSPGVPYLSPLKDGAG